MRAIAIEEFGGPEKLKLMDLPDPKAGKGEVLVRVVAAGVNPVDWKICQGLLKGGFPHGFPLIPGWDVAGTIEDLGEGVTGFRKGERVWAYTRKPVIQWGAYAQWIVLPESSVSWIPPKLLFEEAAAVPLAGLTAYQSLFKRDDVRPGSVVLVHAAAGGVGHFAVQLAGSAGARVVGTASRANHGFLLDLGVEEAIDYTREDFVEAVRKRFPQGVDVVFDTQGGDVLTRSLAVLKRGGRLVSILGRPRAGEAEKLGVTADYVFVEPSAQQLAALADLATKGRLKPHVAKIYPLAEAADAHRQSQSGHVRGKLVLAL